MLPHRYYRGTHANETYGRHQIQACIQTCRAASARSRINASEVAKAEPFWECHPLQALPQNCLSRRRLTLGSVSPIHFHYLIWQFMPRGRRMENKVTGLENKRGVCALPSGSGHPASCLLGRPEVWVATWPGTILSQWPCSSLIANTSTP